MAKIQVKRNTAANAASSNQTLASGEFGFETDTGNLKIGDGSTAYNSLPYIAGGAKLDSGFTFVDVEGDYTLQSSDLTLINQGKQLIFRGDADSEEFTFPPDSSVLFPNGASFGIEGFSLGVAGSGVTLTGTRGDLTFPADMTVMVMKVNADEWKIYNGLPGGGGGGSGLSDNYDDIDELIADQANQELNGLYYVGDASDDPTVDSGWAVYRYLGTTDGDLGDYQKLSEQESLDVVFNVLGTALTGYSASSGTISATDSILQAFNKVGYFIANIAGTVRSAVLTGLSTGSAVAISATDTVLQAFEKLQAQVNGKVTSSDLDRVSASVSSGTMTLNMNSLRARKFHASSTITSDFTLAFSNTTNAVEFSLSLAITGTVNITLPSTARMQNFEKINGRYNDSTRVLTLTGGTATPFFLTGYYDGSVWRVFASDPMV
jgi:hypothetical protein